MTAPDDGPASTRIVAAVAVHDRRDLTVGWVRSLLAADGGGLDLHLVLVDDGSTDGTADAVRALWPTADIIAEDGSRYWALGTNRAIEAAMAHHPDFVLVANDDTELDRDCLQLLVACARANPRSVVGPVLVHADDPDRVFQTYPRWQTRYGGWRHRHHLRVDALPPEPLEAEVIVGNAILVPAAAIAECGLLDDRGVHNWVGDAEWTPRFARAGWRLLIEPTARVRCHPNRQVPSPWAGGLRGVTRALRDPLSPYSLRATWANRVISGPDPARGALAFTVHLGRLALRRLRPSGPPAWPDWPDEPVPGRGARSAPRTGTDAASSPMHLVLLWPYLTWGGAQTHLIGMVDHLGPGIDARALVPTGSDATILGLLADHGIAVDTYGPPVDLAPAPTLAAKVRRRLRDVVAHVAIWRATADLDPASTVLHVDLAPWSSAVLLQALSRRAVVFQTLHTAPPPLAGIRRRVWQAKLELVRARPDHHITLGNRDAGRGFDRLLGRALGAALTPTAVDAALAVHVRDTVDAEEQRARLAVPEGMPLVVGAGQLIDRKGVDVVVDALARRSGTPIAVRWFGSGPARDAILQRAAEAGVADQIQLVDASTFPTRTDLFRAIAAADLYVQPSREEGLPLALVEAMALGVPVVASAINGIPEVVEHQTTGLLVPPDDPSALARAIDDLLDDPALAARLARAGLGRIQPEHDLATVGPTMALLYRRALEDRTLRRREARP